MKYLNNIKEKLLNERKIFLRLCRRMWICIIFRKFLLNIFYNRLLLFLPNVFLFETYKSNIFSFLCAIQAVNILEYRSFHAIFEEFKIYGKFYEKYSLILSPGGRKNFYVFDVCVCGYDLHLQDL